MVKYRPKQNFSNHTTKTEFSVPTGLTATPRLRPETYLSLLKVIITAGGRVEERIT
jgi:hypothetical protein